MISKESAVHNGHTITLRWFYDEDSGPPWENEDGHGPVSDWTRRDPNPGEIVLSQDHGSYRYYDMREAVKIAKRDGWDCKPYGQGTKAERAKRSAQADFDHLHRWATDQWWYCGYQIQIEGTDWEDSLWGIDSESVDQFTQEAFASARAWLDKEHNEKQWADSHGIETVK